MLKSPYHKKELEATLISLPLKSSCGELITFFITLHEKNIVSVYFTASGSQLTLLALHTLCEYAREKSIAHIVSLDQAAFLNQLALPVSGKRAEEAVAPLLLLQSILREHV